MSDEAHVLQQDQRIEDAFKGCLEGVQRAQERASLTTQISALTLPELVSMWFQGCQRAQESLQQAVSELQQWQIQSASLPRLVVPKASSGLDPQPLKEQAPPEPQSQNPQHQNPQSSSSSLSGRVDAPPFSEEGNASPEFPGLHKAGIVVLQRLKAAIDSAFAEKRWPEVAELSAQYTALHAVLK